MKVTTMLRLAQAIQLLKLDGVEDYTQTQLALVCGLDRKTLQRNAHLITIIDFALSKKGYHQCILYI